MKNVLRFEAVGIDDIASVGGKNASLGEMVRALAGKGVRVPGGFATTADAFSRYLDQNELNAPIAAALKGLKQGKLTLAEAGKEIRTLVLGGAFSDNMRLELCAAYSQLAKEIGVTNPSVAVRSSATAEDLPNASFAGQQETFLNVSGETSLLDACRRCYASLFTDRAISYRELMGFYHLKVALSVGVQHMVRSDLAGSGVMFTIDTETGFAGVVVISAAWGLGETIVQGLVDPDKYLVFKPLLANANARPIIEKSLESKARRMVYSRRRGKLTRLVNTTARMRNALVLDDGEILELARAAVEIEAHYGRPMDIEWAKDGQTGELYILQARPETVQSGRKANSFEVYKLTDTGAELCQGAAIGDKIVSARTCVIRTAKDIGQFEDGAILVTEVTDPDWVPIMKRAAGIVTDHGCTTSHAAIVSRELGVPAIIGTGNATAVLRQGQEITISCACGDKGIVYNGNLAFTRETVQVDAVPATKVEVILNIADPGSAFQWWRLPAKGVGLARMEFIISALVKAHPMALAHPERLGSDDAKKIRKLTASHASPAEYFVDILSRGIAKLASPFYPHPAIVRLSDFKTNEYASLIGGKNFESLEENPMLGFRGASRYYDERYRDGFILECKALKRVREEMCFTNVIVMVPFCRTLAEADKVLAVMADNGLNRGEAGLQVYMMCDVPSNVILADKFAQRFDGFSIGSNDLTQLVLGVDRDAADLAALFDERDDAVKQMICDAIRAAHGAGIKIGICGQAPSNYPDFAAFLVREDIDSISLNPDTFLRTIEHVAKQEASSGT